MADQHPPPRVDARRVVEIVGSYVRHHRVPVDQLTALIVGVHRALAGLGGAPSVQEPPRPAVPIRGSVQPDFVVCLECGYRARTLRRHLRVAHGLGITGYLTRWNLSADYPLIAPSYSMRRSAIAKQIGLGRKPGTSGRRRRPEG